MILTPIYSIRMKQKPRKGAENKQNIVYFKLLVFFIFGVIARLKL